VIDKPLYENPLAGGQQKPFDLSKMNKNPYNSEFIGIGKDQTNLFGYKVPDYVIKEQEERAKNNPINMFNMTPPDKLSGLLLSDPQGSNQLGSMGLTFRQEGDMGRYVADNDPGGIAAGFSNLQDYLAAGNLPQPTEGVSQDVLGKPNLLAPLNPVPGAQQATPPRVDDMRDKTLPTLMFTEGTGPLQPSPPSIFPFPGMDSTEVASAETNPYNRVGQQLTGPNQDDILGTLKNIEQGIASLGQGSMNQSSFGGFNNNFGIGSFFPPYGGMYG
jgi:hypothetical protein